MDACYSFHLEVKGVLVKLPNRLSKTTKPSMTLHNRNSEVELMQPGRPFGSGANHNSHLITMKEPLPLASAPGDEVTASVPRIVKPHQRDGMDHRVYIKGAVARKEPQNFVFTPVFSPK
ncbi:hypothetical protein EYF80_041716 [Liparis tanakae]|uniref:Uncharacterized protein n=1 Tax=Liparis tanakae TaxID=230148 RepID=A0A4Z2G457_9TELE|nr:hypothetical protein EYF80_041716 [Liparis tanakae]